VHPQKPPGGFALSGVIMTSYQAISHQSGRRPGRLKQVGESLGVWLGVHHSVTWESKELAATQTLCESRPGADSSC